MRKLLFGSAVIAAGSWAFAAMAADDPAATDISSFWQHSVPQEEWENPPSGPGPVRKMQGAKDLDPTYGGWMGDYHNPILQPWAAEAVRKEGEHEAAGGTAMTGQLTCRPSGVPGVFTVLAPVQIVQSPRVVAFLYQRDHQVRIVRMNAQHPAKPEPSYYGDSVGHYEGDTLVIDTIGMNDKTWTDRFGTPHTEALHVVERYTVTNGGKTLRDFFTVEDKGAFTTAWSAVLNYSRARQTVLEEEVCAENNRGLPVPVADIDPVSGRKLSGAAP
jgi:hypothetical protein